MSIAVYFVFLLLSRESLSQMVFPGGSSTGLGTGQVFPGNNITTLIQTNVCVCVVPGKCSIVSGNPPTDGSGILDIRIVNTASGITTGIVAPITTPVSSGINPIIASQSFCSYNLELCCPTAGYSCGMRYSPFNNAPSAVGTQAPFGAYPWQIAILTNANVYVGAGVLIDHMHVLTVAHKVSPYLSNGVQLKVRMGEWDASNNNEPIPFFEYNVARIFTHPSYSATSLMNSIAILRLSSNVPLGLVPTMTTGCLTAMQVSNMRCWVAGWGSASFNVVPSNPIQTHVDVPLVDQTTCQTKLRTTKLGSGFVLDPTSFMCAGGEAGKDACTGDGGSPLVCPIAGRFYVVGLVAWGIGCGTNDIPGVYINVSNFINWIQSTTNTV